MRKITLLLLATVVSITAWADIPDGYYTNAVGKKNEALMTALEGIINAHTERSYAWLWTSFDYTDVGSDGYYIDMYSNCKYNNQAEHTSGALYVGQGINREHSFPKSWFNSQTPTYTDMHMLIPTDAFVNQHRSNYPYGVCADGITYKNEDMNVTMLGKLGTSTYNGYTSTVFEPDDEYKGDFARIYFYMVTCYKSSVSSWPGSDQLDASTNGYKAFSNWSMQMLMEWHRADPVSAKEIARNEAVYSSKNGNTEIGQGNRNPFVDHPELAEYIWGNKQNTAWTGEDVPDDPIVKVTPVMQPVDTTGVTGSSFRADWTSGGDVSSYTLQVNRVEVTPTTLLLSEGFSKVNVTEDKNSDISSSLTNYTDNDGWTGYKVYQAAEQSLKIGTGSAAGYLITPSLELGNTVSVVVTAKNWISSKGKSDGSSIVVSCGDVSETIVLSDEQTDYTVVLDGCTDSNIKLAGIGTSKRFYVYHVDVYNGSLNTPTLRAIVEEGDSTHRTVSGITDTCYTVSALAEGTFRYVVKAVYTDGTTSDWSNVQLVTLTGESTVDYLLGDVNGDGRVDVADVAILIDIVLGKETTDAYPIERTDVNHDSDVDVADVSRLIDIILGKYKE